MKCTSMGTVMSTKPTPPSYPLGTLFGGMGALLTLYGIIMAYNFRWEDAVTEPQRNERLAEAIAKAANRSPTVVIAARAPSPVDESLSRPIAQLATKAQEPEQTREQSALEAGRRSSLQIQRGGKSLSQESPEAFSKEKPSVEVSTSNIQERPKLEWIYEAK